jgi:hypothetical protein
VKRRAPQAYSLDGEMWPVLAVVRCDEGDVATFEKLAWEWVNEKVGGDFGRLMLRPPKWQWFRMNPCDGGCGAHAWHIAEVDARRTSAGRRRHARPPRDGRAGLAGHRG